MILKKTIASLIQNFSRKSILSKHTCRRERRETWEVILTTKKPLSYKKVVSLRSSCKHRSRSRKQDYVGSFLIKVLPIGLTAPWRRAYLVGV